MFLVATMVFFLTRLAPAIRPRSCWATRPSSPTSPGCADVYGLDKPVLVQFRPWLKEVASGNLGQSIFLQRPVTAGACRARGADLLPDAVLVADRSLIGIPAGIVSAVWRGGRSTRPSARLAMLAASMPSFWLGLDLHPAFAVRLGWFPGGGLWRARRGLGERLLSPRAAGRRAGRRQLGADHCASPAPACSTCWRGLHPHGAGERAARAARRAAPCAGQRADARSSPSSASRRRCWSAARSSRRRCSACRASATSWSRPCCAATIR